MVRSDDPAGRATPLSLRHSSGRGSTVDDTQNQKAKRKSQRDQPDHDSDDGKGRKRQRHGQTTSSSQEPLLACPFFKYDSRLFGPDSPDEAYRVCASCSFSKLAHLKQHLQRAHYKPRHYCVRCREKFSAHEARTTRVRPVYDNSMCARRLTPPRIVIASGLTWPTS